jgi:hypothetical protein
LSDKKIYYFFGIIIVAILGFFVYDFLYGKKKIEWNETYGESHRDYQYRPYDLTLLRDCLTNDKFKTINIDNELKKALKAEYQNTNYIFIGEAINADSADFKALFQYIERGNDAFVSTRYFPKSFLQYFLKNQKIEKKEEANDDVKTEEVAVEENLDNVNEEDVEAINNNEVSPLDEAVVEEKEEDDVLSPRMVENDLLDSLRSWDEQQKDFFENDGLNSIEDSIVNVCLLKPDSFTYKTGYFSYFSKNKSPIKWNYFDEKTFEAAQFNYPTIPFSKINKYTNGIAIKIGNGNLFIHAAPILFTNIELQNESAKNYNMKVLSMLRKGDIFWDNYNRTTKWKAKLNENWNGDSNNSSDNKVVKTPLQYILSTPALAWAWKSLLAMGIIFLLFSAKRRQRVIPILAKNTNTSLQFIQNIGRMYFNEQNHNALSKTQFKQWQWFVRERYGLFTTDLSSTDFQDRLSQKSNIALTEIQHLISAGQYMENYATGQSNLINFHNDLEKFYHRCK